jgi:hypothetical protein
VHNVDPAAARHALDQILARPEFRSAHAPSWLDRVTENVLRWLLGVVQRTFGSSAFPTITNVLVYALIAAAVVTTAVVLFRRVGRDAAADSAAAAFHVIPPRPWTDWLDRARTASRAGDWREAIRLTHWCAIAWLEARGSWRPDPSRTPREYVRLVQSGQPAAAALRALTELAERVWYGTAPADDARFAEALGQLKALGCPVD